jgi:hypothetical protein
MVSAVDEVLSFLGLPNSSSGLVFVLINFACLICFWVCYGVGFQGLQGHWDGGKVMKFWGGEMKWQVGHGWLVAGVDGWLSSQMSGKFSRSQSPRVEGNSQFGSCRCLILF